MTLSGLDPNRRYAITLTANRGDPRLAGARHTRVTLTGAPGYQNASSAGVVVHAPNSVSFGTGFNTVNGYVARWVEVQPGADGRVTLRPAWDPSRGTGPLNNRGYAMTALVLEAP